MAQSVAYIAGFETGDASEIQTLGASTTIQATTVRSGGYALKLSAATNTTLTSSLSATQMVFRGYFQFTGAVTAAGHDLLWEGPSGVQRLTFRINAALTCRFVDRSGTLGLTTTDGTTVLTAGRWYQVEMALDLAAGGIAKLWLDGNLEINITHTTDKTPVPAIAFVVQGEPSPNDHYLDDVRIDVGGVAAVGAGHVIARQGIAGTPNADAWTKHGASVTNAYQDWSDTPFDTTNYCDDTSLSAFQTMLIGSFSTDPSRAVEGTQVINTGAVLNAVKVGLVGKSSVTAAGAGAFNIRSRVNSVNADVAKTFTTADAYYETIITTPSLANLNAMEAGAGHGGVAATHTVRDVWVMVDYSQALSLTSAQGSFALSGQAILVPLARKVVAALGSFALNGKAVLFPMTRKVLAVQGSFALNGQTVLLRAARKVLAVQGAFTFTGQTAVLRHGYVVVAAVGSFVLSGKAAILTTARKVLAAQGSFALNGQTVLLRAARKVLAAQGSFALTGLAAILTTARKVLAAQGSFALNGQTALLNKGKLLVAAMGAFALTGQSAILKSARSMAAATGQFAFTGFAILLSLPKIAASIYGKARKSAFVLSKSRVANASLSQFRSVVSKLQKTRISPPSLGD